MKKSILTLFTLLSAFQLQAQNYNLIVGTYTQKSGSEGIYVYKFNAKTGETVFQSVAKGVVNPSYLSLSPDKKFLYSVNESGPNSVTSAFSFDRKAGKLTFLNQKAAIGDDPCFIAVDENNVILANYSGGNISIFGRAADGSLTPVKQVVQHTGKSIDPKRQTSAHVHQVQFSPDKKYLIANDLGEDQVYIYAYDPKSQKQVLTLESVEKTNLGSGPRHLAFAPNGKYAYLTHEFNGMVTAFSYTSGNLTKLQEIKTVSDGFKGAIDGADIHVSPDGKFLYQTNRGAANQITVFAIQDKGMLKFVETVSTLGKAPRNFSIDPSGNFLLVAHQNSNDVVIFKRNQTTGKLQDSGKRMKVGSPVCLLFSK